MSKSPWTSSPKETFATSDIEAQHRARHWRESMAEVYFDLDVRIDREGPFRGAMSRRAFAESGVSSFESDAHRVVRRKEMLRRDKIEQFVFVFPTSGWFRYRQLGNEECAGVDEMYLVRSSEYYEVDMSDEAAMLAFSLPCDGFGGRLRGLEDLVSRKNVADPLLVSTLREVTRSILADDALANPAVAQELCCGIVDVMLSPAQLAAEGAGVGSGDAFVRHMLAKTIRQRLGDPAFGVAEAAQMCGVSTRKLQLVLATAETTFGEELMAARLDAAALLLGAPGAAHLQIGQIAYRCGFVSPAHFATSYRRRFGRSPSEQRAGLVSPTRDAEPDGGDAWSRRPVEPPR